VTNVFVGNLDFGTTEVQLRAAFSAYGTVQTVTRVMDRDTRQPRGFAFVEMANAEQAEQAIRADDGTLLHERAIRVNEARPQPARATGQEISSRTGPSPPSCLAH
jgi:cold-inducible RNA-binding protein